MGVVSWTTGAVPRLRTVPPGPVRTEDPMHQARFDQGRERAVHRDLVQHGQLGLGGELPMRNGASNRLDSTQHGEARGRTAKARGAELVGDGHAPL